MFNVFLNDTINICRRVIDEWGAETETVQSGIKAYIETRDVTVHNTEGKEVKGSAVIILDTAIDVKYNDRIQMTKKNSTDLDLNTKKFEILNIEVVGGFGNSHIEVII